MIYDGEARCFGVDFKSSEIVRKDSRISYTRDSLLSLSEANYCKELPAEVVKSSLRDLKKSYAREDLLALAKLNACKELPYGFVQSIISDLQDAFKSAPEIQKRQGHESLSFCRTSEASTDESTERWDSCKSKDAEKFNWHQLRRPWVNPTTTSILNNASQKPEARGVLGSWSGSKPSQGGSEISSSKLPESHTLLSRCSQPYRPPPFYKALSHPETPKLDENGNKTFRLSESPSKQTATEESWRKDAIDLKTNEPLQATEEKQNSSERDEEVVAKSGVRTPLQEHSALHIINRFSVTPPILSPVSASAEPPSSTCKTAESVTEDALKNKPLQQSQEEVPDHVEKLRPNNLGGSRFSALIILDDAEDIDPNIIEGADPPLNVKPKGDQRSFVSNKGFVKMQKKELRNQVALPLTQSAEKTTHNRFPNNAVRKTTIMPADMKALTRMPACVKPLSQICSSEGGFRTQQQRYVDIVTEESQNSVAKNTSDETKQEDILKDRRDSCELDSRSVSCSSENDNALSYFSSWPSLDNIFRTANEMSLYDQEVGHGFEDLTGSQISEVSNFIPSFLLDEETDSDSEINLPDEDSLITVDDTYIFQEETLKQSPVIPVKVERTTSAVSRPTKPPQTDSLHPNLTLPHQWFHDSQRDIAKQFVNPSNTQTDLRTTSQLHNPWRFHHYNYTPFPADAVSIGQPPLIPQIYDHSRVQQAHSFYSHINNTLPVESPSYCQMHQIPWRQKEPDLLRNLPLNYQGNINSSYVVGMRGRPGGEVELRPTFSQIIQTGLQTEKEIRPTFSQIIQMQIGMAKMKLESLPGFKQRASRIPISNSNR